MNVAIAHPTFWPEVRRGAERIAHEVARGLAARGHRVRIVTSHRGRPGRDVVDGVDVERVRRPPDGRLRRRLYEDNLPLLPVTWWALRREPYDVVEAMQPGDAVAAARTGIPTVFSFMGIPHRAWLVGRRGRLTLVRHAACEAGAVTALSQFAADAFERWLGVRAEAIHPPVDLERFSPGGERAEHPTIVCAADPREPRKRVDMLVEAFARVRREHPRARLLLLGNPRPPQEGVEWVRMGERLPALYRSAWVSALPSWGEAFGLVLAEALACGTPVVGTDREGIPEVLGGNQAVGRLFPDEGPEALARALLEAIELAREPATAAACRAHAQQWSLDRCARAHEEVHARLLA